MNDKLPILYGLQYHPSSKPQAMALAKLMADIEPGPQAKMGFMFCPRFDALVDTGVEAVVREKFPDTRTYVCRNQATGWPKGPNAMVHEIYSMFSGRCNSNRPDAWRYAAIFFGEPDCVPLSRDWVDRIWNEWHTCDWGWPEGNSQLVLGHWLTKTGNDCGIPHINGNCLISPKFIVQYPAFNVTTAGAWDTTHSRGILEHARPSKLIFSDYGIGAPGSKKLFMGEEDLFKTRVLDGPYPIDHELVNPVYLHGCKDIQSIDCVRRRLNVPNVDYATRRNSLIRSIRR